MEFTIYIDVYFMVNFIIDTLLLIATAIGYRRKYKAYRLILASIFGSIVSIFVYIISINILSIVLSIPVAAIMILICFNFTSVHKYIKTILIFILNSFVLFCITYVLFISTPLSSIIIYDGIMLYLNINFGILVLIMLFIIIGTKILTMIYKFDDASSIYKVEIINDDLEVTFNALLDTGNSLCDEGSSLPVLVIQEDIIKKILHISDFDFDAIINLNNTNTTTEKFRYVAYKGVFNSNSLMPIFTPSKTYIIRNNKKILIETVIGITSTKLSTKNEYEGLLSPLHFK